MERIDSLKIYVLAEDFSGYASRFWAQHGVSFLLELRRGNRKDFILFDTGTHHIPLLNNAYLLRLDMSKVQNIVLSHSHYDHTGGIIGVIKETKKSKIFAHLDIFKESFAMDEEPRYIGPPENMKEEVEKYGGEWVLNREPVEILPGVWTLGELKQEDREEFERMKDTRVFMKKGGKLIPDFMEDEIGLLVNTKGGVVVIGGCSHPGIIGMTKRALEISGEDNILAVIGGFHLVNATEDRIEKTAESFLKLKVGDIYTGHCTGLRAECVLYKYFGKKFHKLHAGMIIDLI